MPSLRSCSRKSETVNILLTPTDRLQSANRVIKIAAAQNLFQNVQGATTMYTKQFLILITLLGIAFFRPIDSLTMQVQAAPDTFDCTTVSEIPQTGVRH